MRIYKEEIFGPVLSVVRAKDYEEAVRLPSEHEYGNGVAIFTRDGDTARDFTSRGRSRHGRRQFRDSGAARLSHASAAGSAPASAISTSTGPDSIRFYTKTKTVTSRWPSGTKEGAEFVIPTMK